MTLARTPASRIRKAFLVLSTLLCLWLGLSYTLRPDPLALLTLWPVWIWLAPGLLLAGLGLSRATRRATAATLLLWLAFLVLFAEEPRSLLRRSASPYGRWQTARAQGQAIRVISLNCAGGSAEAAAEVARCQPDIVLLQESPGRDAVEKLGHRLFGKEAAILSGVDASLIAHGRLVPAALPRDQSAYFVQARVHLASGLEAEILSFRLTPATLNTNFLSPASWREQTQNRRARRAQLAIIARRIDALPSEIPILVGGDSNAPQGDAVFRTLSPRLHDTFPEAGRGWGNTIMNDCPLLRIDQIWASPHFQAISVQAQKTQYSDHRMVICDIRIRQKSALP